MKKIKILIAYSSPTGKLLMDCFRFTPGFEIVTVLNLKTALEILDQEKDFDLVICDIDHPSSEENVKILDEGESIEMFLHRHYIVFNFIKKLKVKFIIACGFPEWLILNKLNQIGAPEAKHVLIPLFTQEWVRVIKNFVEKGKMVVKGNPWYIQCGFSFLLEKSNPVNFPSSIHFSIDI